MVKKNFLMTAPLLMASFCSAQEKPNVVLIMVDDMGYSDIGCYGGEILTPNIDALASKGVRFTQFYNTSRSCPARASLMTGLYQHQAGIGQMSEDPFKNPGQKSPNDWGVPGYKGFLNRNCVTIAEVLKEGGYHTYMAGKWHWECMEKKNGLYNGDLNAFMEFWQELAVISAHREGVD